ncbi:proline-rich protein 3 [Daphnia magna]|uniref:Cuticle protein n=2 Tax=Daphnia magna TaxID=35525 RepID=A0A0P5ZCR9_9CRUS|nr:proline-rich protein 3 [Daphnia magna]KAK4014386.1 hypothetical protein OUZ56_026909 [Daphnia magna]KZS13727.1 Uncharacterized protein APZ42_021116 [Daphnia magna]
MEIKSAVIVSVLMAALFVNTSATYSQSSPYSAVSYSEVDSDEQESHEATYPAKISYGSTSATAAYSNSEEKSIYGKNDKGDEKKNAHVGIEYPTYKEAEYVTTSYPVHIDTNSGDDTLSYTTVAYSAPVYNEPQHVAATYTPPVYSPPTYTAPTLDVPVYRTPTVLPYWMRSGYAENSIGNDVAAY